MKVLPLRTVAQARDCFRTVAEHLAGGGILAYPTETVYGIGTALAAQALESLVLSKGREQSKPFLVLAANPPALPGLVWTPAALVLAECFWPGPLSLALSADRSYSAPVRSQAGTVAVRDTPLPALRLLLELLGQPLTSTSANLPGQAPATSLPELLDVLARLPLAAPVLALDGGSLPASLPSSVVDCSGRQPRLVRAGAIPIDQLRSVLQEKGFAIDV